MTRGNKRKSTVGVFLIVSMLLQLVDFSFFHIRKVEAAYEPSLQPAVIASGSYHTLIVQIDGTVKASGYDAGNGGLGLGNTTTNYSNPVAITGLTNIKQVAAYGHSSYALLNDGTVKSWGQNSSGQLGLSNSSTTYIPTLISNLSNVKQIVAGNGFAIALLADGTLKGWGTNAYGELLGTSPTTSPVALTGISNVKQLAAGEKFVVALLNDGTVKSWGQNNYGQLGNGNTTNQNTAVTTFGLTNIKQVAAGAYHALALLQDGTVKSWGYNGVGQLGINNTVNSSLPVLIPTSYLSGVRFILAGSNSSASVLVNNTIKTWGNNSYGQLGLNSTTSQFLIPALVSSDRVAQAYMGSLNTTIMITTDNKVYSAGANAKGQLGIGDTNDKYQFTLVPSMDAQSYLLDFDVTINTLKLNVISGTSSESSYVLNDGIVWAWGRNHYGQLGVGDTIDRTTPTMIPGLSGVNQLVAGATHTLALMGDGTVKAWGKNDYYGLLGMGDTIDRTTPTVIPGLSGVKQLVAGSNHTLALMENGTVKAWGYNGYNQLGLGNNTYQRIPVIVPGLSGVKQLAVGFNHSLALMENGTVKAWGDNIAGQLGVGDYSNRNTPTEISGLTAVKQLVAGQYHTLALMEDSTVKAWGWNFSGQTGLGVASFKPATIPGLSGVKQLTTGSDHTLALMEDGTVKAWGLNFLGQLGLDDTLQRSTPVTIPELVGVSRLAAGYYHTLVLMEDGTVKAWGSNNHGQLGLGDTTDRLAPVNVPELAVIKQLVAGEYHSLALMVDGTVEAWGFNDYNQLGLDDTYIRSTPVVVPVLSSVKQLAAGSYHTLALMEDGAVKAWGRTDYDTHDWLSQEIVPGLTGVKQLFAGYSETFALMEDGTVQAWGTNDSGQLGLGDYAPRSFPEIVPGLTGVKQVAVGSSHTLALMEDGTVKAWGSNFYGELGLVGNTNRLTPVLITGLSEVKQLVAGVGYTLALMEDGTVKAWGYNIYGQLGLNDITNRNTPVLVHGLSGVKQLVAGYYHSLAIMEDGTVKAWGYNNHGQLGLGDTAIRTTPVTVLGLSDVNQLVAGSYHTLALMEDGSVKAWGYNQNNTLGVSGERHVPTPVERFQNNGITVQVTGMGPNDENVNVKYYLDNESEPREQQATYFQNGSSFIKFQPISKSTLKNGTHSVRVVLNTAYQSMEKTASFIVQEGSTEAYSFTTTSSVGTITATVANTNSTDQLASQPFRFTIGTQVSSWMAPSNAAFTVMGLKPDTRYAVKMDIKNVNGAIQSVSKEAFTLAQKPSINVQQVQAVGDVPVLNITDTNPTSTKYQILLNTKYLTSEGRWASQPTSLPLQNKTINLPNLDTKKTYSLKVRAINQEGTETEWTTPVSVGPPIVPPAVPNNVKLQPTTNSILISWSPVSEATGYEIEADNSSTLISVGKTLNYKHQSLSPNTLHQYRVRAVKDGVAGPWSVPVMQRTLMVAPIVPNNISSSSTAKTVTVTWNAVSGAFTYEVEWDGQLVAVGKQQTFKQIDLPVGSRHAFRVRALNAGGAGPWSQMQIISTTNNIPTVPVVDMPSISNKSVQLRWQQVEDALTYEVEADGVIISVNDANSAEFTGLSPGTNHQYRVRATNEMGAGAWSTSINVTTNVLATPTGVLETVADTSIKLSWPAVNGATSYEIEADGQTISISALQHQFNALQPESVHTYRIRALGTTGNSAWTEPFVFVTLPLKPAKPQHISATASKDQVFLSWGSVNGAHGYDVELDGAVIIDNFTETSYTDQLLDPFTVHQYRIRARTDAIEGDWSDLITLRTLPDRPVIPSDIVVTSTANIVTLNWASDVTVTKYEIEIDGQVQDVGNKSTFKHRRVAQGSEHKYRIRTNNVSGAGDWSGYIINNTLVAKLSKTNTVDLGMVGKDIMDFSRYTLKVTYDPNAIEITDLSTLTGSKELTTGRIAGTDVIVVSFRPGEAVFMCDKAIALNESWTGVINSIQMRAKVSGGSSITYSVIEHPN